MERLRLREVEIALRTSRLKLVGTPLESKSLRVGTVRPTYEPLLIRSRLFDCWITWVLLNREVHFFTVPEALVP